MCQLPKAETKEDVKEIFDQLKAINDENILGKELYFEFILLLLIIN